MFCGIISILIKQGSKQSYDMKDVIDFINSITPLTWVFNPLNDQSIERYRASVCSESGCGLLSGIAGITYKMNESSLTSIQDVVEEAYGYPASSIDGRFDNGVYKSDGEEDLYPIAVCKLSNGVFVWFYEYELVAFVSLSKQDEHHFVTRLN